MMVMVSSVDETITAKGMPMWMVPVVGVHGVTEVVSPGVPDPVVIAIVKQIDVSPVRCVFVTVRPA
jgi:hypothetical protein